MAILWHLRPFYGLLWQNAKMMIKHVPYFKLYIDIHTSLIIAYFQISNAEQFNLPPELNPHEHLPFSWKWKEERHDENETFPKNCTVCNKFSRGMPIVSCDFCPCVYHLDCLDPPLCEVPSVSKHYSRTPQFRKFWSPRSFSAIAKFSAIVEFSDIAEFSAIDIGW